MQEFELPLLPADSPVEEAFTQMIVQKVSGVVIQKGPTYQVAHYKEIMSAWEAGVAILGEVKTEPVSDYIYGFSRGPERARHVEVVGIVAAAATVRSSSESLAGFYLRSAPGCCCDGPGKHPYPPNSKGSNDACTVLLCNGKVKC